MKDYVKIYLDKKFPHKIDVVEKKHPKLKGITLDLYKSGDKRLFVKISGFGSTYHFHEAQPQDLQNWFELTYNEAEKKLLEWVSERLKKQDSQGIYEV